MDWLDLLAAQGTLKSLLQHHSSKASILLCPALFMVQLSQLYITTGKTTALLIWTLVSKVMSLLFNMLSRLVIAFLPRSKCLNFMAAVTICSDFGAQENKVSPVFIVSPSICHEVMGPDAMIFVLWMLSFKSNFSLSCFTFIKRLFSSSSLSAIRVVSSAYLRLLIFLPAVLILACASSSLAFCMMYSAYKLNKQSDNIQPCCTSSEQLESDMEQQTWFQIGKGGCQGNYKQNEKTTLRMKENNSKWSNWQKINLQNIQAAHIPQYQKNEHPNQKMRRKPKQAFLQRRQTDGQQTHEKVINITHIREMQIKTTMRCLLIVVRMAIIKKSTNNKFWRGCG